MAKPKRRRKIRTPKTETDLSAALDAMGPVAAYPAGRVAWWRDRIAILDRHRRRSQMHDVEAAQERHSPTVSIAVDDSESTKRARRNLTRVRQSEAWHNKLSGQQRDAEREMAIAWKGMTVGLGASQSKLMYMPKGNPSSRLEFEAGLAPFWRSWHREAGRRGISQSAFVDLLTEPVTLAQVE
jgi:hypothetical protein